MTDFDIWLFSQQGNEPKFCPHCDAHFNDCVCDEDYDLQEQLTELDSQHEASLVYVRGVNELNKMR